jgi:hypothetical protein
MSHRERRVWGIFRAMLDRIEHPWQDTTAHRLLEDLDRAWAACSDDDQDTIHADLKRRHTERV